MKSFSLNHILNFAAKLRMWLKQDESVFKQETCVRSLNNKPKSRFKFQSKPQNMDVSPTSGPSTDSTVISLSHVSHNAVVTCEIKLFPNYFGLRRRPTEINLFQRMENLPEIILKLFQKLIAAHEYFPTCSMSLK